MYIKIEYLVMVATATYLAKVFIFIGKVAIVVGNVFIFKLVLVQNTTLGTGEIDNISSTTGPMVVVAVITYIFVSMFIGMFDETVNAMLTCVAIDTRANGEPIYGPETFNNCVGFDEDQDGEKKMNFKRSKSRENKEGGVREQLLENKTNDML
jgi:hypothetical protein